MTRPSKARVRQSFERAAPTYDSAATVQRHICHHLADCLPAMPPVSRLLDAGCGKGHFSRALAGYGHRVDGIDASPAAVALCQESGGSRESYAVSTLASWRPAYLYDAAICVDVLFHLMDDADWLDSVRNLASLVRLGGSLVLADHDSDEDRVWSAYHKTRARSRYNEVLAEAGFEVAAFILDQADLPPGHCARGGGHGPVIDHRPEGFEELDVHTL